MGKELSREEIINILIKAGWLRHEAEEEVNEMFKKTAIKDEIKGE